MDIQIVIKTSHILIPIFLDDSSKSDLSDCFFLTKYNMNTGEETIVEISDKIKLREMIK